MRILADLHIAPRTVQFLRSLGHDTLRVSEVLPPTAADTQILARAAAEERVVLTQDLDFAALVALSGAAAPSVVLLRLVSSRVEYVNGVLQRVLPTLEAEVAAGAFVTVTDHQVRRRRLPIR